MHHCRARNWLAVALLAVIHLWATLPVLAQQSSATATLLGHVEDTNGAAVTAASIRLTNLDRNQSQSTVTDDHGRFTFLYLAVGSYQLKIEHQGFAPASMALKLSVGQTLDVPVHLAVAGMTETQSVQATPVIETARTQVAETVSPAEVDNLPLNGRNYLDLAALTPAVSRAN